MKEKRELIIKIDSREQWAYEFDGPSEIGKLDVRDYSVVGLESYIAVERKTLDDLIACLTIGRERFEKELHRGRGLEYFCLVIEAPFSAITTGRYRSRMSANSAIASLLAFSVRYKLPIWFCGSREHGQRITEGLLKKYTEELTKRLALVGGSEERNHDGKGQIGNKSEGTGASEGDSQ